MQEYNKGFSLLELLAILAITAILLGIAIPILEDLFARNRALVGIQNVKAAIKYARFSAVMLGINVLFCGSSDHQHCDGSWSQGQIIVTQKDKVLRVLPGLVRGDKLIWKGNLGKDREITFLPEGTTNGQWGSCYYLPKGLDKNSIRVTLLKTGRVS